MGKIVNFYYVFFIKRYKNLIYYDNVKFFELYKCYYFNFIVCFILFYLEWKYVVSWGVFKLLILKVGCLYLCIGKRDVGIEILLNYWLYIKIDEIYDKFGSSLNVLIIIIKKILIYIFWKKVNKFFFYCWFLYCWIEYVNFIVVKCV